MTQDVEMKDKENPSNSLSSPFTPSTLHRNSHQLINFFNYFFN